MTSRGCVSIFELHQFVTRAESSPAFDAHVTACEACARRLSELSRRAVAPVPLLTALDDEPRRLTAFVMAAAACLAVMLVQAMRVPRFDAPIPSPEGVHGVSRTDDPRLVESIIFTVGSADSGATDSGVR